MPFKIDIGRMREKIVIEKFEKTKDKNGITKEQWTTFKKLYASVNNLFGKEYELAKAAGTENTIEFTVRYSKHFENLESDNTRIIWRNKKYNITFVDNMGYENKLIKFKAMVIKK